MTFDLPAFRDSGTWTTVRVIYDAKGSSRVCGDHGRATNNLGWSSHAAAGPADSLAALDPSDVCTDVITPVATILDGGRRDGSDLYHFVRGTRDGYQVHLESARLVVRRADREHTTSSMCCKTSHAFNWRADVSSFRLGAGE